MKRFKKAFTKEQNQSFIFIIHVTNSFIITNILQSVDCNNTWHESCNTHHHADSDSQSGKHCPFHWGTLGVTVQSTPQRLPWGWVCPKCHCNPCLPRSSRHWQQTDTTNVRTTQQLGTFAMSVCAGKSRQDETRREPRNTTNTNNESFQTLYSI